MRTFKDNGPVVQFSGMEGTGADSALELSITAVIIIEILMSGTTAGTDCMDRDITFGVLTDSDRFNKFSISFVKVSDKFFVIILFLFDYDRRLINLEFLILRGMGIIESPLLKGNIFADKRN